ncbi:MAG: hypothetical protein QOE58_298 [Actinomycetota bacterium]|nr:hypothetical protein [Actinomycetota bacterium]
MNTPAAPLAMSAGQRESLTLLARSATATPREVQRAKVLLLAADGVANSKITARVGVTPVTVRKWRDRFEGEGLAKLGQVREGRGRKPMISSKKRQEILRLTQYEKPSGAAHWSCRSMAKAVGVSPATVQRIWSDSGLKPHLVKTFSPSDDPAFDAKLVDIVGVYLNPPQKAVVLCMDEKTSTRALDHTQTWSPTRRRRAGRMTSDSKRYGTTMLFAALQSLDGSVVESRMNPHRDDEFLKFLRTVDREVPKGLALHIILDGEGTQRHSAVTSWPARHPRFHQHFASHNASWLNLVDRWFHELTDLATRRGAFHSLPTLITAIEKYMEVPHHEPRPLVWTAMEESILAKSPARSSSTRPVPSQQAEHPGVAQGVGFDPFQLKELRDTLVIGAQ